MRELDLQERLRVQLGLRVGTETAKYVLRRLADGSAAVPVIGADARTGVPVQKELAAEELKGLANMAVPM